MVDCRMLRMKMKINNQMLRVNFIIPASSFCLSGCSSSSSIFYLNENACISTFHKPFILHLCLIIPSFCFPGWTNPPAQASVTGSRLHTRCIHLPLVSAAAAAVHSRGSNTCFIVSLWIIIITILLSTKAQELSVFLLCSPGDDRRDC